MFLSGGPIPLYYNINGKSTTQVPLTQQNRGTYVPMLFSSRSWSEPIPPQKVPSEGASPAGPSEDAPGGDPSPGEEGRCSAAGKCHCPGVFWLNLSAPSPTENDSAGYAVHTASTIWQCISFGVEHQLDVQQCVETWWVGRSQKMRPHTTEKPYDEILK